MRRATACALMLILALAGLALAGCGSDNSARDAAAARARARAAAQRDRLVAAGRPVFAKHCASCHTIEGRVAHPTFIESPIPNLDEVKPQEPYVRDRVEIGGIDMPSLKGEMSAADFAAVVAYVTDISGSRIVAPHASASELGVGRQVFDDHCQRCHGIDGRRYTGSLQRSGTDFTKVKPSEALVIRQVLRGTPEEMPSFRGKLTRAQLRALAAYVTTTAGE